MRSIESTIAAAPHRDAGVASTHSCAHPQFRSKGTLAAAIRVGASLVACVLPMFIEDIKVLGFVAAIYLLYALRAGVGKKVLGAVLGLFAGWMIFGLSSYLFHRDVNIVIDMLRTFVLRFAPLTLASIVLVTTTRQVDVTRLLRTCGFGAAVLLPLSSVLRDIPRSTRELRAGFERLRQEGTWTGPLAALRHPRAVLEGLLGGSVRRWAREMTDER
jgi:hypothetical protein